MSIAGLDHVQVAAPVGCEASARRYYGDLLGLAEVEKPEPLRARGGAWFQLGDQQLHIQQLHIGVDQAFEPALKAHPATRVVDRSSLDAVALRSEDPWGNRIELLARA